LLSNEFIGDYTEELYPNVNQLVPVRDEEGNTITTPSGNIEAAPRQRVDRRHEPLHGFWTTPQFKIALEEFDGIANQARSAASIRSVAGKAYLAGVGWIKMAKVGLNPYSYGVNTIGGMVNRLMAGAINPKHYRDAFVAVAMGSNPLGENATPAQRQARENYLMAVKAGMTGKGIMLGDVRANLSREGNPTGLWDLTKATFKGEPGEAFRNLPAYKALLEVLEDPKGGGSWVRLREATADLIHAAGDTGIRFMDDVYRVNAFLEEMDLSRRAFPDRTQQEHIDWAGDRAANIYQNYDRLLPALRGLSRIGVLNTFVSFKFEFFRNAYWVGRYAKQGITSGNAELQKDGYKKAVALTATALGIYAVSRAAMEAVGADDDDRDALQRWCVPPWDRGEELVLVERKGTRWRYVPMGYLLPTYELTRAFNVGWRAFRDPNPELALTKALRGLAADYFGPGAFLGPLIETAGNFRIGGGRLTYAEGLEGAKDRAAYLARAFRPNIGDPLFHAYMGATGELGSYGRKYDLAEVAAKLGGLRVRTVDIERQLPYTMREFSYRWRNASTYANIAKNKYAAGNPKVVEAETYRDEVRGELKRSYAQFYRDMLKLGVSEQQFLIAEKEVTLPKELKYSRIAQ